VEWITVNALNGVKSATSLW